jgi:hypothetical protein
MSLIGIKNCLHAFLFVFAFITIKLCCSVRLQESDTVDTCSDMFPRYVAVRILGKVFFFKLCCICFDCRISVVTVREMFPNSVV